MYRGGVIEWGRGWRRKTARHRRSSPKELKIAQQGVIGGGHDVRFHESGSKGASGPRNCLQQPKRNQEPPPLPWGLRSPACQIRASRSTRKHYGLGLTDAATESHWHGSVLLRPL